MPGSLQRACWTLTLFLLFVLYLCPGALLLASAVSEEDQPKYAITAEWSAPGEVEERLFGHTVAIENDLVAIATDRGEDGSLVPGSVHLYSAVEPKAPLATTIRAPDRKWPDDFGAALAFANGALLIGAPGDAEFGWDAGASWIFLEENGAWQLAHRLEPPAPEGGARFGHAVAFNDTTVAIGAPRSDVRGLDSGAVHIFEQTHEGWQATARLEAPDGEEADFFGSSVALWGKWIAVGAWGDDDNGEKTGAVWIFFREKTGWHAVTKVVPVDGIARDRFGCSLAFVGADLVVAASGREENRGAVYVFRNGKYGWTEGNRLFDLKGKSGDWFGYALAGKGNLLVVGAPGADGTTELEGRVALFEREKGGWVSRGTLSSGPSPGEQPVQFGWSVATDGVRAAVGRIDDADGPAEPGRAWLVEKTDDLPLGQDRRVFIDP